MNFASLDVYQLKGYCSVTVQSSQFSDKARAMVLTDDR